MINIGDKIGKLTVLKEDIMTPNGQKYLCECECGNVTSVREDNLENGRLNVKGGTRSCGCLNPVKNHCQGIKRVDRIGDIINNYQYVLRLMPDSNRSYKFLVYDLTNGCWRVSGPRWISNLAHNPRYEFSTADAALQKYYKELASKSFSKYQDENNIMTMLYQNHVIWTKQFSFEDCKDKIPLPFDIAVFNDDFELDYLIEYDGEQHFKESHSKEKTMFNYSLIKLHDSMKNKYCFENNIPLIRIPYDADYVFQDLILKTTRFLLTPENEKEYYESRR